MGRLKRLINFHDNRTMIITLLFALGSFLLFVYHIGNPEDFVNSRGVQAYLIVFGINYAFAVFISIKDFADALLERGHYKDKDWHIAQKAVKLISKYVFLIFAVLILTTLFEVLKDFEDKNDEMFHYVSQYRRWEEDNTAEIEPYVHNYYFNNKKYRFWLEDTMYVDGEFTPEFLEVQERMKAQAPLEFDNFIELNQSNIIKALNEDLYYVVQTLTTLGYGDITPNQPMGMTIAWVAVLAAQFITIIGVILIVRDK